MPSIKVAQCVFSFFHAHAAASGKILRVEKRKKGSKGKGLVDRSKVAGCCPEVGEYENDTFLLFISIFIYIYTYICICICVCVMDFHFD